MQFGELTVRFNPDVTECDKAGVKFILNDDTNPIPFETVNENILAPMPDCDVHCSEGHAHTSYTHTYIHTYIQHTYIHTYILHTYIHTYIHAYIHAYIHTYVFTYMHKYVHT